MQHHGDVDGDGFLEYQRRTPNGLVQQGWKDSQDSVFHDDGMLAEAPIALCEVQGYAYAAWRGASALARALGHTERSPRSRRGQRRFGKPSRRRSGATSSAPTRSRSTARSVPAWCGRRTRAIACSRGIVDAGRALRVAESLLGPDLFSGWGIRTIGTREARYNPMSYHNGSVWPHDNAIAAAGLARYGLTDGSRRHRVEALRREPLHRHAADAGTLLRLPPPAR